MMQSRHLPWMLWLGMACGAWGQTLSFTVAPAFPAGTLPTSVASGDFNGDTKPDLAVTNQTGVSILLNDGNGGFQPRVDYTFAVGSNPQSVAVGDFNGDNHLDLAVVSQGTGIVSILLGNPDGSFQPGPSYPAGSNPRFVVVADIAGNGKHDLVIADSGFATGSGVSVLLCNGDGTFQNAQFTAAGSVSLSVAVGDFDGDQKTDLAVANSGSDNVSVLRGNGNGTFQPAVNYNLNQPGISVSPTSIVTGDFNRDGKLDLAVATPNVKDVAVMLGLGNGGFQPAIHYGLDDPNFVNANNTLATADLNRDTYPDLILVNLSANHVTVLLGLGDGTFPTSKSYAAGPEPTCVAVDDFNGDGKLDLAFSDNAIPGVVAVLTGNGDGTLRTAPLYRSAFIPDWLVMGDLNNDGKMDLVAASHYTATGLGSGVAMLGNGDGTFRPPVIWNTTGATSVALGHFTADGKLGLAETNSTPGNGNVSVLLGNGDGTFQTPVPYSAGTTPTALAVADLNGDKKDDLVVANLNSTNVSVLLNTGNGTFQPATNYATPVNGTPSAVTVADFNGDGTLSIAVAISGINATTVAILQGNGNGTFQPQFALPLGFHSSSPLQIAAADFDGDGKFDLAVTDGATLSVLISSGGGAFRTPVTYLLVGAGKAINGMVAVGDFNGDNKLDLVATSRDGISILLGNGDGSFQSPVTFTPFIGGAIVVGDFDGDGRPDLVAADNSQDATTTDTVAMLLNTSLTPVPVTIASTPTGLLAILDHVNVCTTPCYLTLNWRSVHAIYTYNDYQASSGGVRYHFDSWSDGGADVHQFTVPKTPLTLTENFKPQYLLQWATSPAAGGTFTLPDLSLLDLSNFVNAGTAMPIGAFASGGYVFTGWTGNVARTASPFTTVTMSGPQSVTANFAFTAARCDLNADVQISVTDVQKLINQVLWFDSAVGFELGRRG